VTAGRWYAGFGMTRGRKRKTRDGGFSGGPDAMGSDPESEPSGNEPSDSNEAPRQDAGQHSGRHEREDPADERAPSRSVWMVERSIRWILGCMAFLLPLAGHPIFFDLYDGTKKMVAHVAIGLVLVVTSVLGFLRPFRLKVGPLAAACGVALLLQTVSIVGALNQTEVLIEAFNRFLWLMALFVTSQVVYRPCDLEPILIAGLVGAWLSSLVGLAQSVGFNHDLAPQVAIPSSTFGNKNMAAEYILMWVPLGLFVSVSGSNRPARILGALSVGYTSAYVFVTGTRAAYVASLVSLVAFFVVGAVSFAGRAVTPVPAGESDSTPEEPDSTSDEGSCYSFTRLRLALIFLLVGFLTVPVFLEFVRSGLPAPSRRDPVALSNAALTLASYSTNWRLVVWANTLAMARDHVVCGVGLGNWRYQYPRYHRSVAVDTDFNSRVQADTPHNDYLQNLAETGLVGTLGLLFFVVVLILSLRRAIFGAPSDSAHLMALCIATACLIYAVNAVFSFPIAKAAPTFLLFTILGALEGTGPALRFFRFHGASASALFACFACAVFTIALVSQSCWAIGDIRFKEGLILYNQGRVLEAYEKMALAYRMRPFDPSLAVFYGGVCQETNRLSEAREVHLRASRQHPNFTNIFNQLGNLYWKTGDRAKAAEAYEKVLSIHPGFEEALRNLASLSIETGKLETARDLLERLIVLDPNEPQHWLDLGEVYRALRKPEHSRERLMELVKRWPNHPRGNLALAHLSREEKRWRDAEHFYRRAIELDPKLLPARLFYGTFLGRLGRTEDARKQFVEILRIDPANQQVKVELEKLGKSGASGRIVDASEAALRDELRKDPKSASLHAALADLYISQSRLDLAMDELRLVVSLDPRQIPSWAKLGKVLAEVGSRDLAITTFLDGLKHAPESTTLWNELGLVYQQQRKYKEALDAFQKAAKGSKVPPEVFFNLGAELGRAGRPTEAIDALNRFLSEYRGNPEYRRQAESEISRLSVIMSTTNNVTPSSSPGRDKPR